MSRDSRKQLGGPSGGPVRFRTTFRNTIHDLFRSKGWVETESETEWDVAWVDKDWMREHFMALSPGFAEHQVRPERSPLSMTPWPPPLLSTVFLCATAYQPLPQPLRAHTEG